MGDLPFGSKRFGDKRRKPVAIMSLQPPLKRCRKANGETSETAMDADDDHGETSETKIYHVTLRAGSIIHFVTPDPLPLPLKAEEDHAKPNDTTTNTTETTADRNDNSSFISQDGVRDLTELLNSPDHDQTTTTEDSQAI